MIASTDQQVVAKPECVSNQTANIAASLPVIKCAAAVRFGYRVKLINALVDGKCVGYVETEASNPRTAQRFATMAEFHAALEQSGVPMPTPWVDYDPIAQDMARNATKSVNKPNWTGD